MLLGRVLGKVVATLKAPGLEGVKLLTVQILNQKLEPVGRMQVAADATQAGTGDLVVLIRAREAAMALPGEKFVPVDLACVGIIDELDIRDPNNALMPQGYTRYN